MADRIWASKRFSAPLAIADGDVIRSPGRDGERQGFGRRGIRVCRPFHRAPTHTVPNEPLRGSPRHRFRYAC